MRALKIQSTLSERKVKLSKNVRRSSLVGQGGHRYQLRKQVYPSNVNNAAASRNGLRQYFLG